MGWFAGGLTRLALIGMWIFTPLVSDTFDGGFGGWAWPVIGILFLPVTIITYIVVHAITGDVAGWAWVWVIGAILIDLSHSSPAIRVVRPRAK